MTRNDTDTLSDDAADIRHYLSRATAGEPNFATPTAQALTSAVLAGRRRRARARVGQGLAVVGCAALVGVGVVSVRSSGTEHGPTASSGGSPLVGASASPGLASTPACTSVSVPRSSVGPAPVPSSGASSIAPVAAASARPPSVGVAPIPVPSCGGSTSTVASLTPSEAADIVAHLDGMVRHIAAATGGTVTSMTHGTEPGPGDGAGVTAHITTSAGAYDLDASVMPQAYGQTSTWVVQCQPGAADDKPCTVAGSSASDFMESIAFSNGSGRSSFTYTAAMFGDRFLDINFTNYTEQPTGQKTVGPHWNDAGYTYQLVRDTFASMTVHSR